MKQKNKQLSLCIVSSSWGMIKGMLVVLLLSYPVFTNASILEETISLKVRQMPAKEVVELIERQANVAFNYSKEMVDLNYSITIEAEKTSLKKVLDQLFNGRGIEYVIESRSILLKAQKSGQQKTKRIDGVVKDERGDAIIGANIVVKGGTVGTVSDIDGAFELTIPTDATLAVSYVGYLPQEIRPSGRTRLMIRMQENSKALDELVVVGYGVQKKSDITGSVTSLKPSELTNAPIASTAQALQGKVAGVVVQNTSGDPSGGPVIRIRGANSLTYGNDPLIIIDGIQDGNLGSLNPNQIASVEILKDAAALSVYGSKGANGVVIVTTKDGNEGKPQVSYNGFVSFDQVTNILPILSATEYAALVNESRAEFKQNPLFTPEEVRAFGQGTNWQREIFRDALSHNHNLSVSGSKNDMSYFLAGGMNSKEGILKGTNYQEFSLRSNLRVLLFDRLQIKHNTFIQYSENRKGETESALNAALQWSPTKSVFESNGLYTQPGGGVGPNSLYNPLGYALEFANDTRLASIQSALSAEFKFTDYLRFSSLLAYKLNSTLNGYFDNQVVNNGPAIDVNGSKTQSQYQSLQNTNILSFNKDFKGHDVGATLVYELLSDMYDETTASARGIPVGLGYNGVQYGSVLQQPWLEHSTTAMMSFMGRVNYGYKKRYLFSASLRYDGASQLADGHKFDSFYAFSMGWNLMEESFMESARHFMPEFKIRGSYGSVGNAAVPAYASHMKFSPGLDANNNSTLTISQLNNNSLKWERTQELNIGIDTRLFGGRISLSAEYYDKSTKDLLMWQKVPPALGVESILRNVGAVSNKGIDFSIGGTPIHNRDFTWTINYTFNYNQNKILALDGLKDMLVYESNADFPGLLGSFVQMVGQPMGTFLGYTYAGVWKQNEVSTASLYGSKPGDAKYVDINRDGKIDKDDIGIIGNAQSPITIGINNTFSYKGFDLNLFFNGAFGNQIYNQNRIRRESYTTNSFPTSPIVKDRWSPSNESDIPAFTGLEYVNSSRWVEQGDYLRLKNVTLGYRFPIEWISRVKMSALRLYVSANNLLTFTRYTGYDPEASMGSDAVAAGVDRGIYPSSKSFLVGLDITF